MYYKCITNVLKKYNKCITNVSEVGVCEFLVISSNREIDFGFVCVCVACVRACVRAKLRERDASAVAKGGRTSFVGSPVRPPRVRI